MKENRVFDKISKSDEEWREQLTEEQYYVTRKRGTERAFSGRLDKHYDPGTYLCICCSTPLFSSEPTFDSGSGWPSFFAPVAEANIGKTVDESFFLHST